MGVGRVGVGSSMTKDDIEGRIYRLKERQRINWEGYQGVIERLEKLLEEMENERSRSES